MAAPLSTTQLLYRSVYYIYLSWRVLETIALGSLCLSNSMYVEGRESVQECLPGILVSQQSMCVEEEIPGDLGERV
jgi:hypothetical protein